MTQPTALPHPPALPRVAARPDPQERTPRVREVVAAAARVLEAEGQEALTMQRLGSELGIRAPSLYKHVAGKAAVEGLLVTDTFFALGDLGHRAVERPGRSGPVAALLRAYRRFALERPHTYRLASRPGVREHVQPGVEVWTGGVFWRAMGEPYLAQALWAFAHGTATLEIDGRFLPGSDLDRTWRAGAQAFAGQRSRTG